MQEKNKFGCLQLDGLLSQWGFLTGSRAFGCADKESDFDVVVSVYDMNSVNNFIGEKTERTPSDYQNGFKFKADVRAYTDTSNSSAPTININIIPVHPHEFKAWWLTTKTFAQVAKELDFHKSSNKSKRHGVFEVILNLYRVMLPELGRNSEYSDLNIKIIAKAFAELDSIEGWDIGISQDEKDYISTEFKF